MITNPSRKEISKVYEELEITKLQSSRYEEEISQLRIDLENSQEFISGVNLDHERLHEEMLQTTEARNLMEQSLIEEKNKFERELDQLRHNHR